MLTTKRVEEPTILTRRDLATVIAAECDRNTLAVCLIQGDRVLHANRGFFELFGLDPAKPMLLLSDLAIANDQKRVRNVLEDALVRKEGCVRLSFHARGLGDSVLDTELHAISTADANGPIALAFLFDMRARQVRHEQLSFLAFLDPLTGLPNRSLFFDRFRETLLEARGRNTMFGLVLAGLDDFKAVNATLGSEAGDYLLKLAGERLSRCVRGSDIVARLGGDRFGLLLPRLSRGEDAKRIADRMIKSMREPFLIGRAEARVGLSLGIALYPPHSGEIDPLYSAAEAAMRESKRAGKGRFTLAHQGADHAPVLIEFLTWSEVLAVGIWAIDEQHQELVDLVNRFGNELKAGHDRERLMAALNRLVQATRTHFEAEENLMREHGLTDIEIYCGQHRLLLEDLQSLSHELDRRSMALTMRYLQDWLIRHIDGIDKPLARALRAAGVQ